MSSLKSAIPIAPKADQLALMNNFRSQDKVVSTRSTGTVELVETTDTDGDSYFLSLTFIPATNIALTLTSGWFRLGVRSEIKLLIGMVFNIKRLLLQPLSLVLVIET